PRSGGLVAQAPTAQPTILTLYSGTGFDGTMQVVAQDIPNLPALGWTGDPASFKIAGFGQWELCEGLHYSGVCHRVSEATAAETSQRSLRLGSARRVVTPTDLHDTSSLVRETAGQVLTLSSALPR